MSAHLGQYCLEVTDLDRSAAFYSALGLEQEAGGDGVLVRHAETGSALALAPAEPGTWSAGNALWKLYVNTPDIGETFRRAVDAGAQVRSEPQQLPRWPVEVAFVHDPDGFVVELVQRLPWPEGSPTRPWLGQYCINVSDIDKTVAFYEGLGLTCTSRTEIEAAWEAVIEGPGTGGKLQLAQQKQPQRLDLGAFRELHVVTEDAPAGVLSDPDGYRVVVRGGA